MVGGAERFVCGENGVEPDGFAGERPDKSISHAHPGGPVECQVADLFTLSCILENTEAEIEGMKVEGPGPSVLIFLSF